MRKKEVPERVSEAKGIARYFFNQEKMKTVKEEAIVNSILSSPPAISPPSQELGSGSLN